MEFMHELKQLQKFSKIQRCGFNAVSDKQLGEGGIKILEDCKNITENSEQRQMIQHCPEKSKRDRLILRRSLAGSYS